MSEASPAVPATSSSPPAVAGDPQAQARREASIALFTIAALIAAFSVLLIVMPRLLGATVEVVQMLLALRWMLALAVVFAGLGAWRAISRCRRRSWDYSCTSCLPCSTWPSGWS